MDVLDKGCNYNGYSDDIIASDYTYHHFNATNVTTSAPIVVVLTMLH